MKIKYNNFLKLHDGEQIFFTTNFKPGSQTEYVLIFNYGLVCSNHHWKFQLEHFDALGYPILIHDYRGHYQSSGSDNPEKITFNQMAMDLKELTTHLHLNHHILWGHSMGVNVCLEYAKLFPSEVAKMILISGTIVPVYNIMLHTHLTGPITPILNALSKKYPKPFDLFWRYGRWTKLLQKIIHRGGFHPEAVSEEFVRIYLAKIANLGPELFFQLLDQMHEHDSLAFIDQIQTPTLIIGGDHDKVIPNYLQRLMHEKISQSELYIIHEGSHVPQADFPEFLNERAELFLT